MSEEKKFNVKSEAKSIVTDDFLGADEWKRSKVGYLTGVSGLTSGVRKIGTLGAGSVQRTGAAVKWLFTRDKAQPLPTTSDDPAQRFQVAMQVYNRTDDDVGQITRASRTHAFTWVFILLALTIWALYQMPFGAQGTSLRHWLFPFFAHLFVIPMTLRSLFWNWQLRTRRLGSWMEFKSNASNWLPGIGNVARIMIGLIAVSGAYIVGAPEAIAQGIPEFSGVTGTASGALDFLSSADSGQIFYQLLQVLAPVGPIEPGVRLSPWAGPLANAFGSFNTILLTVSAAMLGWQTVAGMIATAHEGKMLGQKWHQIWAPVRVTAGVGTLVPIAGGFSAIQLVVLQIALWGSGMADQVWNSYAESYRNTNYLTELVEGKNPGDRREYGAALREMQDDEDAKAITMSLLHKQVCLGGIAEVARQSSNLLAASNSEWERNRDLSNLSEEEFSTLHYKMKEIAPNISTGITFAGEGTSLTMEEVMTGRVEHNLGFDHKGGKVLYTDASYPSPSEATQAVFKTSKSPVVQWNFGSCGSISLDFFSIRDLEEKLSYNPGRHQTSLQRRPGPDEYDVDVDAMKTDIAEHQRAYNLIMQSADRVGSRVTNIVFPNVAQTADILLKSNLGDPVNNIPKQAYLDQLYDPKGPAVQALGAAYQSYVDTLESERFSVDNSIFEMTRESGNFDGYIDMTKDMGWASAGSFYMIIARMQEVNHSIQKLKLSSDEIFPATSADAADSVKNLFGYDNWGPSNTPSALIASYTDFSSKALKAVHVSPRALQNDFADTVNEAQARDFFGDGAMGDIATSSAAKWVQEYIGGKMEYMADVLFGLILNMEPDPYFALVDMVEFGQLILGMAIVIFMIGLLLPLLGGAPSRILDQFTGGEASNLMQGIAWVVKMAGVIILAVGLVHAYIIPMIPYIMFNFFVVGMLILIAEALVAAPIWAFMHVRMDGQEFVDQVQRPGYMIAFNLFLRPTLAILGLILSFSVFSASIWFLNNTFEIAARGAMSEGTSFIGSVSMLLIMTYMHYQMAIRSFKLINELPDRVVRWFGQGGEQLGEADEANRTTALFVGQSEDRITKAGAGFQAKKGEDGDGAPAPSKSGGAPKPEDPGGSLKK